MPQVKELKELDVAGPATTHATKDFFVQLHLTERCNLSCRHCYQSGTACDGEMPLAAVRRMIAEAADMLDRWNDAYDIAFNRSMHVTGGEPFMRPDLPDVLATCKEHGFATHLLSNATLVNADTAKRIKDAVDSVQVSIEGPEAVHDAIRGKGAFVHAVRGIAAMVAGNIPVTLNLTLSRVNVDYIEDLQQLAYDWGVQRVGLSRLVPAGKGADLADSMLGPERLRDLYASFLRTNGHKTRIETGDPLAGVLSARHGTGDAGHVPFGGCAAGVSGITVLPDGTMTPCRRCPVPLGNIIRDSMRAVWATSPVLRALRDRRRYKGRCGPCVHWAACRGCRAVAYAHALMRGRNDFLGDDPQCWLKPYAA